MGIGLTTSSAEPKLHLSKIGGCDFRHKHTGHPVFELAHCGQDHAARFHMECPIEKAAEVAVEKWEKRG